LKVRSLFGEQVFGRFAVYRPLLQYFLIDQVLKPLSQYISRHSSLQEVFETAYASERIAKYEQRPAFADNLKSLRNRTIHVRERFVFHGVTVLDKFFQTTNIEFYD